MTAAAVCFACGSPAIGAAAITFDGRWIGDGLVCGSCGDEGGAVAALRREHADLLAAGTAPDVVEALIRRRISGSRAQA